MIFGTKSKHSRVKLLKPSDDMMSHINKYKSINKQHLTSIEKKLEEDEAKAILLASFVTLKDIVIL